MGRRLCEDLIIDMKLLILTLFHLRSQPPCPSSSAVKRYSYKEIKKATESFRRVINGSSPQTSSYKAVFQNGRVATVREAEPSDHECGDNNAFYREVRLLGSLHHRHIVALNGFSSGTKRFLVFENTGNGSLKEHLSDPLKTPLNWRTRLQIVIGVAAAVEYLHFFCEPAIYHVSLSSSTILLDENLTAKISDISLSSAAYVNANPTRCSRECTENGCKTMIFQLGLVVLELITGQSSDEGGEDLVKWVQESNFPRSIHHMIDPDLGNNYDPKELNSLLNVARLCIMSPQKPRICTSHILWYFQKKLGRTKIL